MGRCAGLVDQQAVQGVGCQGAGGKEGQGVRRQCLRESARHGQQHRNGEALGPGGRELRTGKPTGGQPQDRAEQQEHPPRAVESQRAAQQDAGQTQSGIGERGRSRQRGQGRPGRESQCRGARGAERHSPGQQQWPEHRRQQNQGGRCFAHGR